MRRAYVGLAAGVALAVGAMLPTACGPAAPPGCRFAGGGLGRLGSEKGLVVGGAYREWAAASDPCYDAVARHELASVTPETSTYMNTIAPSAGTYRFATVDGVCAKAEQWGARCQLWNVVWDPVEHPEWGIVPAWVRNLPAAERHTTMVRYVTDVVSHFAGRVETVTVVNEAFNASGGLEPSVFNTTGNTDYLVDAFRAARLADPTAKLFYNDYSAEGMNPKSDAIYALAQRLRSETVTVTVDGVTRAMPLIDGVGLQAHFGTMPGYAPSPASVAQNIARLAAIGVDVRITELDVRVPVVDGQVSESDLHKQADLYRAMVGVCVAAPSCEGVTFWGFTDKWSWITDYPGTFTGQGAALPIDEAYARKPAYAAIVEALQASTRPPLT